MTGLLVLRPVSILVLGYGLLTLSREHVRRYWPLVLIAGAAVILAVAHLLPLPPALWQALPGRETVVAIDHALGWSELWRPLTLDPQASRNALMALVTPCAVMVLAIQLDERQRELLLTFLLALGALTALWGILQLMGNPRGPLYLYSKTSYSFPVGLFANRNHQAVFLVSLIPLLYAWVRLGHGSWTDIRSSRGRRGSVAIGGMLVLIPLVLIAGSRAGLLTLVLALCGTAALLVLAPAGRARNSRTRRLARWGPAMVGAAAIAGLVLVTIGVGRDRAFERLLGADSLGGLRADLLPATWDIALRHLPWGSGIGSFDDVYRMYEPDGLLMPSYVNHAHNDVIELFMTGGVPALLILAFAMAFYVHRFWTLVRKRAAGLRAAPLSGAALLALAILFVASLIDYPLRAPAMASFAVLLSIWASKSTVEDAGTDARRSIDSSGP
ncbi:MAG: O-antigen ligase family protein [Pseudomonadota bacterium]|nr:O-antigen ligase family protein [Pseudomonadota bacterium]